MRLSNKQRYFLSKKMQLASVAFIGIFFLAFSSSPPTGNTNAPGDGSCGNCHGGGSFSGDLIVDIIDSGMELQFLTEFDTGTATEFGWQWTILDDNDNPVGSWTSTPVNSSISTVSGQEYMGHDPSFFDSGGLWITDGGFWDPQGYCGEISIYTATLTANGNGNTGGDQVHHDVFTHTIACSLTGAFGDFMEPSCSGDCDGFIVASGIGGVPPYEYDWSDGQTTATADNLCADTYVVTITDNIGDEFILEMELEEPDPLLADETGLEPAGCFGESNGLIQVTASGGTGNIDFDWGPYGNTCCPINLSAGTYELTITDALGCEFIDSYVITENPEIIVEVSSTSPNPAGASNGTATAMVSGGTPPYEYDWSTGDDTSTITDLDPGTYQVTVTDDEFCEAEATIQVMEVQCDFIINAVTINPLCYGGDGTLVASTVGGVPPIEFDWSDGSQGQLLTAPAGSYSVTATDDIGCVIEASGFEIVNPDSLDVMITSLTNASCANGSDGGLTVAVLGGAGNYTLLWENGLTNDTIINGLDTLINLPDTLTNINTGYFNYVLTDGNGCVRMDSFLIEGNDVLPPLLTTQVSFVYLDEMGTAGPVMVDDVVDTATDNCGIMNLSINGPDSYTCADLGSVMVSVSATDTSNNTTSETALVTVLDTIAPMLTCPQSFTIASCSATDYVFPEVRDNCDDGLNPVLVSGLSSGSIFPAGTTTVVYEATDLCGNTGQCSFDVTVQIDLELSALSSPASCGLMDGTMTLLASGGTPPYTFSPDLSTGVGAGTYTITVTDAGGCQAEATVVVEELGGPMITAMQMFDACPGTTPVGTLEVNGGVSPYNILVDGMAISNGAGPLLEYMVSGPGLFDLTLVDANGCASNTLQIQVTELQFPQIVVDDVSLGCATSIPISQVQLPSGYLLEGNPTTLTAGMYNIVDDFCGVVVGIFNVTGGGMLMATATTTPTGCNTSSGTVSVLVSGGIEPYSFTPFGPDQGGLAAGNYSISVIDATGCQAMVDFAISQENGPSIAVQETIVCFGENDGQLTITGSGGTPPYSYQLGSGSPQAGDGTMPYTFDGLAPGAYNVFVIDANGCSADFPAVIREHPELVIGIEASPGEDCTLSIDELIVSPMGGLMPYTVTTELAADSMAIEITVEDGVGCIVMESIMLEEQEALQASANVDYACEDSSPGVSFAISGGCPPYSDNFDQTINTEPGGQVVTITDSAGESVQVVYTVEDIAVLTLDASAQVSTENDPIIIGVDGGVGPYEFEWIDANGTVISTDQNLDVTGLESQLLTIVVVDNRGCFVSQEIDLTIISATVDLDVADKLVKIYPSPVTNLMAVSVSELAPKSLELLNMNGQVIREQIGVDPVTRLDVSDLPSGIYLLKVEFEYKIVVKRFIKS